MAHTPGPWEIDGDIIVGPPGSFDVVEDGKYNYGDESRQQIVETDGGFYPPREADMVLIAAAPDLLEACKEAVIQLEASGGFSSDEKLFEQLQKAIAKAEGR